MSSDNKLSSFDLKKQFINNMWRTVYTYDWYISITILDHFSNVLLIGQEMI